MTELAQTFADAGFDILSAVQGCTVEWNGKAFISITPREVDPQEYNPMGAAFSNSNHMEVRLEAKSSDPAFSEGLPKAGQPIKIDGVLHSVTRQPMSTPNTYRVKIWATK